MRHKAIEVDCAQVRQGQAPLHNHSDLFDMSAQARKINLLTLKKEDGQVPRRVEVQKSSKEFSHGLNFTSSDM